MKNDLQIIKWNLIALFILLINCELKAQNKIEKVAAGVDKITAGVTDKFTPYSVCEEKPLLNALTALPQGTLPFNLNEVKIKQTDRGIIVEIPLANDEHIYGFGLQMNSFDQKGLRKKPVVNAYPVNNVGYSHAPMPYYVSTKGYAILINTARYPTFYIGVHQKLDKSAAAAAKRKSERNMESTESLYAPLEESSATVTVDIPGAKGIDVFVFEGPSMKNAIQRYNLFSGGGALPALWGLGVKYRVKSDFDNNGVYKMARYFREKHIPCDVFGLEPKWQTESYSSSFVWNKKNFPNPKAFIDSMKGYNLRLNLWEHAYIAPSSPLYESMLNKSGDYPVWKGLVPDFADKDARKIFAGYHEKTFVDPGISGFKMDECDNAEYSRADINWGFPEMSEFPSGINGEQMHQLYGVLYGHTLYDIFKAHNQRSFFDIRSLNAFSSAFPASVYSDTYNQTEYIRLICNSGFSGLLWSPEIRESSSENELIRRAQTAVLSAQTLFNSWYLKNPPWLQYDRKKNNADQFLDSTQSREDHIRKLLNFRMSLIPYLYGAFAKYKQEGIPPFRALVTDYPEDENVYKIIDEYMIGNDILAAPLLAETNSRKIYLPEGNWYDFNTNKKYAGKQTYTIDFNLDQIPVFIKEGAIIPLARPVEFIAPETVFDVTCNVYGTQGSTSLFEDDGITFNYEKGAYNTLILNYKNGKGTVKRNGGFKKQLYHINGWKAIKDEK
ncbi:glycoside hydrolase family 31 protein [Mucilaginibacter pocheonensis]|uniref:Alpha-D-xyloside xylohydrolase n=1 Tax=Mucilaginibacter pocheonensis TaxID=398050 RepID=A0ABU1TGV0_9SPHI|nr:TIM-barrel domain-containing protein [Mucilaginibacter pocheonensis]MDR6944055.1 alpha-D-xyloside xylohydrolase [Mucilaginibacter pocheonensis]